VDYNESLNKINENLMLKFWVLCVYAIVMSW